jgi:biotin carboxyl carrier protein
MTVREEDMSNAAGMAVQPAAVADAGAMLAGDCARLGASAGALLSVNASGAVSIVAVHPRPGESQPPPRWLQIAVRSAGCGATARGASSAANQDAHTCVDLPDSDSLYGQSSARRVILLSLPTSPGGLPGGAVASARGAVAFVTEGEVRDFLARWANLRVSAPAGELYALHAASPARRLPQGRLAEAMAVLAAVNEHERFLPAAMAFCNELAGRLGCERVSLGFADERYVRLRAMSHVERFVRRMELVGRIEAAMEECQDQDTEVSWPAGTGEALVCRAAGELATHAGGVAVLSLPLRRRGEARAVATLERSAAWTTEEAESLRLACDLCGTRLMELERRDRWVGARAASAVRRAAGAVVGPRHTWAKLAAAALLAGALYAVLGITQDRIEAPFAFQAARQQVVAAPYDAQVEAVLVSAGDKVAEGQVLARLRTLRLRRELNAKRLEAFEAGKQADAARAEKNWAEAQMAAAKARQAAEQIALLEEKVEQAAVRATIAGTVVVDKMEGLAGATVEKGAVMFEVAPLEELRAELRVDERRVGDLLGAMRAGEVRGELAAASYPDVKLPFVADRLHPIGQDDGGRTVFPLRVRLLERRDWMRPGMAGVAHVPLARKSYAALWAQRLERWMKWNGF